MQVVEWDSRNAQVREGRQLACPFALLHFLLPSRSVESPAAILKDRMDGRKNGSFHSNQRLEITFYKRRTSMTEGARAPDESMEPLYQPVGPILGARADVTPASPPLHLRYMTDLVGGRT